MTDSDQLIAAIGREFGSYPPEPLVAPIKGRLGDSVPEDFGIDDIVTVLVSDDVPQLRAVVRASLLKWDLETAEPWCLDTVPGSPERRVRIYELLGIPDEGFPILDSTFPRRGGAVIIAAQQPWAPWYTHQRQLEHNFYWRAYRGVLSSKLDTDTVDDLDSVTSSIVARLADPVREEPYQSKGLVVGYVQSGKTANFTGVVAKAIDAGYRLVVVLTGTIELLRSQTQRRLDMELVGQQNIGADGDYAQDPDWNAGKFVRLEEDPNFSSTSPAIRRLTGATDDYKTLNKGISALEWEFVDHSRPLNDPKNLFASNIRLAVVKKNSTVLTRLVEDLGRSRTSLEQIPTLIIDDEADQASVNTLNPARWAADTIERTAINARITDLLSVLKRAQYIGYTATPFANVFVDVEDSETIFPKDFIVSLDRPKPYMGGADFHDSDDGDEFDDSERTPANSNKAAFVRDLWAGWDGEGRESEQLKALDSFVLSGAIKLFRESKGFNAFRHHTMLVHESVKTTEHTAVADEFKALWKSAGYSQPSSLVRLEQLWVEDFSVVSAARTEVGAANPTTFEELEDFVGIAYNKISEGSSPVIIVNGEKQDDYLQEALNFEARGVWKILVGGTKLSRGFTVEGLTTTYYTRRTPQADTLMQMGRWFGFRPGYRDLMRLFIGRDVPGPAGRSFDMYEAFATIVADEAEFRSELARFADLNAGGEPMVTPMDVPPMVFQSQPWLKPAAANKMYNAEQVYRGVGGQAFSFTMQKPRGDGTNNKNHFAAVGPLLRSMQDSATFEMTGSHGIRRKFQAQYGIVLAEEVLEIVSQFVWDEKWTFEPHLAAMRSAIERDMLKDFAILLPKPKTRQPVAVKGWDEPLPIVNRKRLDGEYRSGFSGTAVREREAIEHIAGAPGKDGGPHARQLRQGTRGGLILVFANDPAVGSKNMKRAKTGPVDPGDFATLFSYALPYLAEPTPRIGFRVRQPGPDAIVDAT